MPSPCAPFVKTICLRRWFLIMREFCAITLLSKKPDRGRSPRSAENLVKFSHGFTDSRAAGFDVVQRGGIGKSNVLLRAKVFARHSGDLRVFKEIICEITRRVELFAQTDFAQQGRDVRKDVEGACGFAASESVNGIQSLDNRIAPLFEFTNH